KLDSAFDINCVKSILDGTGSWFEPGNYLFKLLTDNEKPFSKSETRWCADSGKFQKPIIAPVAFNDAVTGCLTSWVNAQYPHRASVNHIGRGQLRGKGLFAGNLTQPAASISSAGISKFAATLATSS